MSVGSVATYVLTFLSGGGVGVFLTYFFASKGERDRLAFDRKNRKADEQAEERAERIARARRNQAALERLGAHLHMFPLPDAPRSEITEWVKEARMLGDAVRLPTSYQIRAELLKVYHTGGQLIFQPKDEGERQTCIREFLKALSYCQFEIEVLLDEART